MTDDVLAQLRATVAFADLPPASLEAVAGLLERRHVPAGRTLVEVGAPAHEAFVVLDGTLRVLADTGAGQRDILADLGAGSVVGEIAVLTGQRRSATVRALTDADVVVVPADALRRLVERAPALATRLTAQARRRLDGVALADHIAALFPDMDADARAALAAGADAAALSPGEVLFERGEPADAAYLVVSGRVRILEADADGAATPLGDVAAGQLLGEAALLEDGRRSATAVAMRDTVLARFERTAFAALARRQPAVALPVARLALRRARHSAASGRRAVGGQTTVALVPLQANVDVAELAAAVTARWAANASASHLSRSVVDRALGVDGAADAGPATLDELRLVQWLARATEDDALTLLQGDAPSTPWTRRCVGLADHIVLVARADADPRPGAAERELLGDRPLVHKRVGLALLHPPDVGAPKGTAAWLDPRCIDAHFHVRPEVRADVDRLARQLAGRPVGLVLGGGGARGFAQLGAVGALAEAGVPIDMVAGTSIDATMAALVASPTPVDGLVAAARAAFANPIDYTIPVAGAAKGRRVAEAAARVADGRDVEDFWLPLLCVSTNLTRGRVRLHTRGDLAHAVRASVAIPGVLPPVPDGEDLLVDGGVLNNLPVDVVRRRHPAATLIAVDVAPPLGPRAKEDYGLSVSGTGVLWRRIVPGLRAPKVPGITATLLRSLIVGAAAERDRHVEAGLADLYLPLDLRGVGMLEFDAVADIVERGRRAAAEAVEAWAAERGDGWW